MDFVELAGKLTGTIIFVWLIVELVKWINKAIRKNKNYSHTIKLWDPEGLHKVNRDNAYSRQIKNPKNIYDSQTIRRIGMKDKNGRDVKVWRLVKSAYDEMNDLYIPIYYKRKWKKIK